MRTLAFVKQVNLDQLVAELFTAFPLWRYRAADGSFQTDVTVSADAAGHVVLAVPDTADVAAVGAVVASHAARPAPPGLPPPGPAEAAAIAVLADPASVPTQAQVVAAVRALAVLARYRLGMS